MIEQFAPSLHRCAQFFSQSFKGAGSRINKRTVEELFREKRPYLWPFFPALPFKNASLRSSHCCNLSCSRLRVDSGSQTDNGASCFFVPSYNYLKLDLFFLVEKPHRRRQQVLRSGTGGSEASTYLVTSEFDPPFLLFPLSGSCCRLKI